MTESGRQAGANQWVITVLSYMAIAVTGVVVVIFTTAFSRANAISSHLDEAERLLVLEKPGESLSYLKRIERWSVHQPALEKRRLCSEIRCLVRRSDFDEARVKARRMMKACRDHSYPKKMSSALASAPSDLVGATLLAYDSGHGLSKWDGFRILIEELNEAGEEEALETARGDVLAFTSGGSIPSEIEVAMRTGNRKPVKRTTTRTHPQPTESDTSKMAVRGEADKRWGIVIADGANSYDTNGKYIADVPSGTVVDIRQIKAIKAGTFAVCSKPQKDDNLFLMRTRALDIRTGGSDRVSNKEMALLVKRAKLAAQLKILKEEAQLEYIRSNNPFPEEYEIARKAYLDYWKKVKNLQAKRDSSTSETRMKCGDELREMSGRNIELGQAYKDAKRRYDDWNLNHTSGEDPFETSDIVNLKAELEGVKAKLRSI